MIIKENGRLFIALPKTYTLGDIERFRNGIIGLLSVFPSDDFDCYVGNRIFDVFSLLREIGISYDQMVDIENGEIEKALNKENVLAELDE